MAQLRKKLGHPELIRTVRGLGYKADRDDPAAPRPGLPGAGRDRLLRADRRRRRHPRPPPDRRPAAGRARVAGGRCWPPSAALRARCGRAPTSIGSAPERRGSLRPARAAAVLAADSRRRERSGDVTVAGPLAPLRRPGHAPRPDRARSARRRLAFAEWRPFLGSLSLAGLGGALLAALLSYLLARRLTRPIAALSTRHPAAGRRASRDVAVPVDGEDELADLGRAFNDDVGRAGARARVPAALPGVGQPRAEDAADLDPGLRRGARGGRGDARRRAVA